MGLESMITSSIKVVGKNIVELHPGGTYNLNELNQVETAVVKLHLLSHFCELMAESWSHSGENNLFYGTAVEELADTVFDQYKKFIEAGLDIFSYDEYYMRKAMLKYDARPIVCGQFNAGPDEKEDGLPEGWYYDWPGHASKNFEAGRFVIDADSCVRIGVYEHNDRDNERPIDWIEIIAVDDCAVIYKKYPAIADELIRAVVYVKEQYQI